MLIAQFSVNFKFFDVDLCIKKWQTWQPLIKGRRKGDLYVLSTSLEFYFSNQFKSG